MNFSKIVLVSDTPRNNSLAYFYFLALKDTVPSKNVVLIDKVFLAFFRIEFVERILNFLYRVTTLKSKVIYNRIISNLEYDDFTIIIFFNNGGLKFSNFLYLSKIKNIFSINYLSDHPFGLHASQKNILRKSAPFFDLFITFSSSINSILYRFGAKKVFNLPFAYCRYTHLSESEISSVPMNREIHYFGTWTSEIEDMLLPLVNYDLKIHGDYWNNSKNKFLRNIAKQSNNIFSSSMIDCAKKARLIVNFTRASHMCLHTMKTFELAIASACVISNFSEEQNSFFPNNDSMIYFNTKEEMLKKINLFLIDANKNMEIRRNAFLKAKSHDYHSRCISLINYIESL